jgi:hypothetical protein
MRTAFSGMRTAVGSDSDARNTENPPPVHNFGARAPEFRRSAWPPTLRCAARSPARQLRCGPVAPYKFPQPGDDPGAPFAAHEAINQ